MNWWGHWAGFWKISIIFLMKVEFYWWIRTRDWKKNLFFAVLIKKREMILLIAIHFEGFEPSIPKYFPLVQLSKSNLSKSWEFRGLKTKKLLIKISLRTKTEQHLKKTTTKQKRTTHVFYKNRDDVIFRRFQWIFFFMCIFIIIFFVQIKKITLNDNRPI